MPDGEDAADRGAGSGEDQGAGRSPGDGADAKLGLWHRLLLALPSAKRDEKKASLGERLSSAVLKPVDGSSEGADAHEPETLEELEYAERYADDTERLIGLVAAPLSAAIALVVGSSQISYARSHHQAVGVFRLEEIVLLGMSVVMMTGAWYRKRLVIGITMALYGLTFFNLRWWGFGIPFILGGAWYLVRAYRVHRAVREAGGGLGGGPADGGARNGSPPSRSKRYTPPTPPKRRDS
jgi:hypothetical protein